MGIVGGPLAPSQETGDALALSCEAAGVRVQCLFIHFERTYTFLNASFNTL